MSKPSEAKAVQEKTRVVVTPPSGFVDRSDAPPTWDPSAGPVYFIPQSARLVDSKADSNKPSILVHGILLTSCVCEDREGNAINLNKGDVVGVWIAGGNRETIFWADSEVFSYTDGETLKTGKPNEMLVYHVMTKKDAKKKLVSLDADYRKNSRSVKTPWDNNRTPAVTGATDTDSIPF